MIYLDYSATTPVSLEVLDTLNKTTKDFIGNANSLNALGQKSKDLLESATLKTKGEVDQYIENLKSKLYAYIPNGGIKIK